MPQYLLPPDQRPSWLRVDRVLGENGVRADDRSGRRRLEAQLEQRLELEQAREKAPMQFDIIPKKPFVEPGIPNDRRVSRGL